MRPIDARHASLARETTTSQRYTLQDDSREVADADRVSDLRIGAIPVTRGGQLPPGGLVGLQREIGNHAVAQLIQTWRTADARKEPSPSSTVSATETALAQPAAIGGRNPGSSTVASAATAARSAQLTPPKVRVIPAATLVQRALIQRIPANVYEPTQDTTHPALEKLGIKDVGPYQFRPMQGIFDYKPPAKPNAGPAVVKFLSALVEQKNPAKDYEPENAAIATPNAFNWMNPASGKQITFHPAGVQAAIKAVRLQKATDLYDTTKVQMGPQERVVGKVLDAVKSYKAGATPRAFGNIAQEDVFGAADKAHIAGRHVLGGADMPDRHAVAIRAAFGKIGGVGNLHDAVYTPLSSVFASTNDANTAVGAVIQNELVPNWKKHRVTLLSQGILELTAPNPGVQIAAYESTTGGPFNFANQMPASLGGAYTGRRPLFVPDAAWSAWATAQKISPAGINNLEKNPLTQDAAAKLPNVHVRLLSSQDPAHGGWFVHSAYPSK